MGQARAAALPRQRLLAMGTDMAVGKMSACPPHRRAAASSIAVLSGPARPILIGGGIALDAVRVDYVAGAGSCRWRPPHPRRMTGWCWWRGRAPVPSWRPHLPLRGSQATDLLLVHRANQNCIQRLPQITLPPLQELVAAMEALANLARPTEVIPRPGAAVALNTAGLTPADARQAVARVEQELSLPCMDPIRWSGDQLLDAIRQGRN